MRLILVFCIVGAVCAHQDGNKTVELDSPNGKIRGSIMGSTFFQGKIFAFRGLRYAEAPVGQRRFKQAVPVVPWEDIFDASEEGPSCPYFDGDMVDEDCLRLNVYTTALPSKDSKNKQDKLLMPVIVYIHTGGFASWSAQSIHTGPQYLLAHDVVLVTINFRTGPFGFLSTGNAYAPGNLGLKDQVEALRWIQKNIDAFGGDPNRVTLMGYGAGAWSVSLHLLSPMSEGLFHQAIAMSGSAINQIALPYHQKDLAKKVAKSLGCPSDTMGDMFSCLGKVSAEEMGNLSREFYEYRWNPVQVWSPVVEPEVIGTERFLPAQPADLIRRGKLRQVPLITGDTKDGYAFEVSSMIEAAEKGNRTALEEIDEKWDKLCPIIVGYERDTELSTSISRALREFYFQEEPIDLHNAYRLCQFYTDALTRFPVHRLTKIVAQMSQKPVYCYEFTYQGNYSTRTWTENHIPFGVITHDDLTYIFDSTYTPNFEKNSSGHRMIETMTKIFTNFAKTGEPIPQNDEKFANVTWPPFTMEKMNYLDIGNQLTTKSYLKNKNLRKWERLFPLNVKAPESSVN